MSAPVLWFDELSVGDTATAGGKGANLPRPMLQPAPARGHGAFDLLWTGEGPSGGAARREV